MSNSEPRALIADWIAEYGHLNGASTPSFTLDVGIRDYFERVREHYKAFGPVLDRLCVNREFGRIPDNFGLRVTFERGINACVHDEELVLDSRLRELADQYGPISLVNVSTKSCPKGAEQRNIFPNLHFHIDRGGDQPNQISMFLRDPKDPKHHEPRRTSSIFIANAVGHLQSLAEGEQPEESRKALYKVFDAVSAEASIGDIIYEHPWQAPKGAGEIVILDNRSMLHASYHRGERGYPIGVRYLY